MPTSRPFIVAALCMLVAGAACSHNSAGGNTRATPTQTSASASRGALLYVVNCASCHGARGVSGRIGPSLHDERKRRNVDEVRKIITDPEPPMPKLYPAQLSAQDVEDLTAYVETL